MISDCFLKSSFMKKAMILIKPVNLNSTSETHLVEEGPAFSKVLRTLLKTPFIL